MLKIRSLAKKWAARYDWFRFSVWLGLFCCFPGNKISANKFKCQSMNSSLSLKIAPNGGSGSRFLVFSICLVPDLTHCYSFSHVECFCDYQLTVADGGYEKFESTIPFSAASKPEKCMGDHVFILSTIEMVKRDQNYEEASFEFYIRNRWYKENFIKVKRCGVHVSYVDAESETDAIEMVKWTKRSFRHDGEEGDGCPKRLK
ncbi:hypothetical protein Gorai_006752 [Gossypium raimondii]|nr:hypothetical protein [Gossypium raimondii]